MDQFPSVCLERLIDHMQEVLISPETSLDEQVIDDVYLQLTEENTPTILPKLLPLVAKLLPSYPRNPGTLSDLCTKLLRPLNFTQVLNLVSEENLIAALQSPYPSTILLGISIISKASWAPSYPTILSNKKLLVTTLIRTWLSSPHVEAGEALTHALGDLLEIDCDCRDVLSPDLASKIRNLNLTSEMPLGQGLLWRRMFRDQDIYNLLFSLCSLKTTDAVEYQLDKRQKSIAQGRLLRLLPRLAVLNFQIITQSQFPVVEQAYSAQPGGILFFAATEMIDKTDLLMHITLTVFFGELLSNMSRVNLSPPTLSVLRTLVTKVISEDASLKESLQATVRDPETAVELVDLLSKLNKA